MASFHRKAIQLQYFPPLFHSYVHTTSIITSEFRDQIPNLPLSSLQCGAVLQSLTNSKSFKCGQLFHAHMVSSGILLNNTYISSKLAAFYANCGHMEKAQVIFDRILLKNSFLWNFMIKGYVSNGFSIKALCLYRQMMSFGLKPDNFTYPFVIKACGDFLLVEFGRIIHAGVVISGFESDIYVANCLVAMYSKFGDLGIARLVFDRMSKRDLTSWNTMISGYAKNGYPREALGVFHLMKRSELAPDSTTLLGLLSACSELQVIKQGKEVHGYVLRKGIANSNIFVSNSLIELYCNCKSILHARKLFNLSSHDSVAWNTMISGYTQNGKAFEGIGLFCQMVAQGERPDLATFIVLLGACEHATAPDFGMCIHSYLVRKGFGSNTMIATSLISMYSKCGRLSSSRCVFDEIVEKTLISWTAMLSAYGHHGKGREAISIFHEMVENGIFPDEGAFTSVLTACSHAGLVEDGREFFHQIQPKYNIKPTLAHYASFVDLLSRAGHLDEAYEIVNNMEMKPNGDIWASILSGCRLHGNVSLAEVLAEKFFEEDPERVGGYICLSHIYADEKRWSDVEKIRGILQSKRLAKPTGSSFIE